MHPHNPLHPHPVLDRPTDDELLEDDAAAYAARQRQVAEAAAALKAKDGPDGLRRWSIPSSRDPSVAYVLREDGWCSCPGYANRGRCKHSEALAKAKEAA